MEKDFYIKLNSMSKNLGIRPEDALLVFFIESNLNPAISNPDGGAIGINQFYGSTFDKYVGSKNISKKEYSQFSASEQLPFIESFLKDSIGNRKNLNSAKIYISNFLPAALNFKGVINEDRDTIIAQLGNNQKRYGNLSFDEVYQKNKSLDYNNDGKITYGDIEDICIQKRNSPSFKKILNEFRLAIDNSSAEYLPEEDAEATQSSKKTGAISKWVDSILEEMKKSTDILWKLNKW